MPLARRPRPFLLAVLLPVLAACGGSEEPTDAETEAAAADRAVPVEVVVVRPGIFEDVIALTGNVEAPDDATLAAEAAGTLTYLAPLGTAVGRGGTVAQVDPALARAQVAGAQATVQAALSGVAGAQAQVRAAQAQVRAAQAQADLADDTFRRTEPLFRDSILSAAEFQATRTQQAAAQAQVAGAQAQVAQAQAGVLQAQGAVAQARAGLRQAQEGLGATRIVAPFGGVVETHFASRGEAVAPGTPVVRVVSGGRVRVRVGVPERYANQIALGTPVRVEAPGAGVESRGGRVVFVGRAIDPNSRTLPVEIEVENADGALRPAMVVRLAVSREVIPDALTLPTEALLRDERGAAVLVVADSAGTQRVVRRPVELGPAADGRTVVRGGLRTGDRVVASVQAGVGSGDRVRVTRETAPPAAAASLRED